MANITKVTRQGWLDASREVLIEDGIASVKIDRIAKRLGVTRGGFYYNFENLEALHEALREHWTRNNSFLPEMVKMPTPKSAAQFLEHILTRLILEDEYSPQFDLAFRDWARSDTRTKTLVDIADLDRIEKLSAVYLAMGYNEQEAPIRSKVFYYHQIGYYSLGHHLTETRATRLMNARTYLSILCGDKYPL